MTQTSVAAIAEKVTRGERIDADEALDPLSRRQHLATGPPRGRHPCPPSSRTGGDLHHRPQRQLHERLRGALQLLRVLPHRRQSGRLRPLARRTVCQDRRDDQRRRQPVAAAGRAQPRHPDRVVRRPVPRRQGQLPDVQAARALAAGDPAHLADVEAARTRGRVAADRGRARQRARRWRRDSRRSGAQAPQLLRQGHGRRVARRDARSPSCRDCAPLRR